MQGMLGASSWMSALAITHPYPTALPCPAHLLQLETMVPMAPQRGGK